MADIKRALRNIPEKQPGEEPANEGQKGYLRSFGYFSEKLIKDLGILQAAYLVDQADLIKEEGSANIDTSQKRPPKLGGFVRLIFLLGVLLLVAVLVRNFLNSEKDDPINNSDSKIEASIPEGSVKEAIKKTRPEGQAAPVPGQISEAVEKTLDLAVIQYPAIVVTTEKFELLNKEGKETPISVGTTINIVKRSDLGTLKMEVGGELFVGNESRLIGKVELK